jgi:hypothetical protein
MFNRLALNFLTYTIALIVQVAKRERFQCAGLIALIEELETERKPLGR